VAPEIASEPPPSVAAPEPRAVSSAPCFQPPAVLVKTYPRVPNEVWCTTTVVPEMATDQPKSATPMPEQLLGLLPGALRLDEHVRPTYALGGGVCMRLRRASS
jgi:hypothetical protein